MTRSLFLLAAGAWVALAFSAGPALAGDEETPAATTPKTAAPVDDNARRKEILTQYYLEMYGKSLQHSDWITRGMAVISLSRIDDPRVTDLLLDVMEKSRLSPSGRAAPDAAQRPATPPPSPTKPQSNLSVEQRILVLGASGRAGDNGLSDASLYRVGSNVVRLIAWEALRGRCRTLSAEQRKRWYSGTLRLASQNQFHGAMRQSLLKVIEARGPTPEHVRIFGQLFAQTNSLYPGDASLLKQMRQTAKTWRSASVVRALIKCVGASLDTAPRADWLLRGFKNNVPAPTAIKKKGAEVWEIWPGMQREWAKWMAKQKFATTIKPKNYWGQSNVLPPPQRIDPQNNKWRKDLELPQLKLSQLDVTFVVDSTGSMQPVVNWIQRDVRKMLQAFALLSREPRIGVTFYRDHKERYVTQVHALTGDGTGLSRAISTAAADGGGDVPEAVFEALHDALLKQRWSTREGARKVIVLVGDAPPHSNTMGKIEKLVKAAAKRGWVFYCIKAKTKKGGKDLSSFDKIAKWGKGQSFSADFSNEKRQKEIYEGAAGVDVAIGGSHPRPDRQILQRVMRSILIDAYKDRVGPFTTVMLEYLETPVPEHRLKHEPGKEAIVKGGVSRNPKSLMGGGKKKGGKKHGKKKGKKKGGLGLKLGGGGGGGGKGKQ